jgi:signal transduction histidine kinase
LKADFETQLAVERAGNRMTADLHDDIGTTLSSINVYSTVARQLIETDVVKAKEILGKLATQSKAMLENLGEIIWSLKTGKDQFVNIESRIKNYVSEVLSATNIHYTIEIQSSINGIKDVRLRKNALLIVKEAVNNAVKYSNATILTVKMTSENNQIMIAISDNGVGFATNIGSTGNGLHNMEKRAEELNGTFTTESAKGNGTNIIVTIPINNLEEET